MPNPSSILIYVNTHIYSDTWMVLVGENWIPSQGEHYGRVCVVEVIKQSKCIWTMLMKSLQCGEVAWINAIYSAMLTGIYKTCLWGKRLAIIHTHFTFLGISSRKVTEGNETWLQSYNVNVLVEISDTNFPVSCPVLLSFGWRQSWRHVYSNLSRYFVRSSLMDISLICGFFRSLEFSFHKN